MLGTKGDQELCLGLGTGDGFLTHSPGKKIPVMPRSPGPTPQLSNVSTETLCPALAGSPYRPGKLMPHPCLSTALAPR